MPVGEDVVIADVATATNGFVCDYQGDGRSSLFKNFSAFETFCCIGRGRVKQSESQNKRVKESVFQARTRSHTVHLWMINLFSLSCERGYSLMPYQIMNLPTIDFVNRGKLHSKLVVRSRRVRRGWGEKGKTGTRTMW